jgi:ABC-type sugar transport system permease subunit
MGGTLHPPANYTVPPFPSLYNPGRDFYNKEPFKYLFYSKGIPARWSHCGPDTTAYVRPTQPDIFLFTLYWTAIFYALTYGVCGLWAGIIAGYASQRRRRKAVTAVVAFLPFILLGALSAVTGAAITGQLRLHCQLLAHTVTLTYRYSRLCACRRVLRRIVYYVHVCIICRIEFQISEDIA